MLVFINYLIQLSIWIQSSDSAVRIVIELPLHLGTRHSIPQDNVLRQNRS